MSETEQQDAALLSVLDEHFEKMKNQKPKPVSNERLIAISSEHWIVCVFPTFLYVILSIVTAFFFYQSTFVSSYPSELSTPTMLLSLIGYWCVHHWFFWFVLSEREDHIIVTSKRVLAIKSGLVWGEELLEVAFDKMKTVEAHKTNILQSVLNFGTLEFEGKAKIKRVPHPGTLARLIEQSMGLI